MSVVKVIRPTSSACSGGDRQYDIQIINAEAIRLLGIYAPTAGKDLLHVTQGIPITPLRAVLDATFQRAERIAGQTTVPNAGDGVTTVIAQTLNGERRHVQIACHPYRPKPDKTAGAETEAAPRLALLLVSDVTDLVNQQQAAAEASARAQANEMLAHTSGLGDVEQRYLTQVEENARLRAQVEEVSALNHTLLAANQQLVEVNATLRGANDDLLVGREEAERGLRRSRHSTKRCRRPTRNWSPSTRNWKRPSRSCIPPTMT